MGHKVKQSLVNSRVDFFYYAFRNVLLVSIPLLIFSIFVFTIPHSSAEISSGADNIQLVLSTSCTVNAVVTSEHTVSLNGGQLDNNVGNTKLSAYCNDNNGYSIYAVGSSGDIDGNTDLIYNNGLSDSYNIRTGVYDSNNVANPSSWAMKLNAGTGTGIDPVTGESVPTTPPTILNGYDNYSAIPNVYTQVAKRTSGTSMTTDTSVSGSYLNTTYQIYANSAQPAGTYNGKVKYIILHPGTDAPNTINDIDAAFAMAGKQKYPQESGAYYAMQDMTTDICNSVSRNGENTSTQLVDLRDNKLYWVAKLADGHCWMTENLDLDIITYINGQGQEVMKPLTSNDTDLNVTYSSSTGQYAEYNDGYTESNGVIYYTPANSATTIDFTDTTVTGWQNSSTAPYTANKTDDIETGHASIGNYYNWTAAIASNYSNTQSNVLNSICSKNWKLPEISNYSTLYNLYKNEISLTDSPLWFVRSGYLTGRALYDLSTYGFYWSNTAKRNTYSYAMVFDDTNFNLIDWSSINNSRAVGASLRCIAR